MWLVSWVTQLSMSGKHSQASWVAWQWHLLMLRLIVQMLLPWIFCAGMSSHEASLLWNRAIIFIVNTSKDWVWVMSIDETSLRHLLGFTLLFVFHTYRCTALWETYCVRVGSFQQNSVKTGRTKMKPVSVSCPGWVQVQMRPLSWSHTLTEHDSDATERGLLWPKLEGIVFSQSHSAPQTCHFLMKASAGERVCLRWSALEGDFLAGKSCLFQRPLFLWISVTAGPDGCHRESCSGLP